MKIAVRLGSQSAKMDSPKGWSLKSRYLQVYVLVVASDWLQGPHVYALYESYGKTRDEISQLFVAGFLSSAVFGTLIASCADKLGRRKICSLFGILYAISCATKHSPHFWILFAGRILAGVATSIMFTAFESWLVCEHDKAGNQQSTLSEILSTASSANGITAIAAGLIAQKAADYFGLVAPFDLAGVLSLISCASVLLLWEENYGSQRQAAFQSFSEGLKFLFQDLNIALTGCVQALFEGSMYIFVLQWTPALTIAGTDHQTIFPHGYIFAAFMVAVAVGSRFFSCLHQKFSLERILLGVMILATVTFIPTVTPMGEHVVFGAFLLFEACVGIFWPCIGSLKAVLIPEHCRATLMNYFRIPVNIVVVVVLLTSSSNILNFGLCIGFLAMASVLTAILIRRKSKLSTSERRRKQNDEQTKASLLTVTDDETVLGA